MLACGFISMGAAAKETITIATVNNGDMITMKELSNDFTSQNPDINLKWVTLEENILRQRVTTDVATKGGQYDVMTIGTYEVPIWGKQNWLKELDNLGENYDLDDLIPAIRSGLTINDKLYAAPFYGESSMVMYRTDLMDKAGLTMPKAPTWDFIRKAAKAMTDKKEGVMAIVYVVKQVGAKTLRLLHPWQIRLVRVGLMKIGNLSLIPQSGKIPFSIMSM